MATFTDPSTLTPLFTTQQVTCAYPISDLYASLPRYLYYALLVGCIFIRWHPWLSDVFLGAAATYAGVAAIEAFVLLAGYPASTALEQINIPYVDAAGVAGNATLGKLVNLVTNSNTMYIWPGVLEYDIDAILAIVVTSYLFMLPVHCFSTRVRGNRAYHLLMGMWNILMLAATICAMIMWLRIDDVAFQYRFCYPQYPDVDTVTNDGWRSSLWTGSWNSTIWNVFSNPDIQNQLTENCLYPCFNTSQILRRPASIVATVRTDNSPRTSNSITATDLSHQDRLAFFVYIAIILSGCTAIAVLILTLTKMTRYTTIPLDQPLLLWTNRKKIKDTFIQDAHRLTSHKRKNKKEKRRLPVTEKRSTTVSIIDDDSLPKRRKALLRLVANVIAIIILFIVVVLIPATWIAFVVWIEYWIHSDLVSSETPAQVGQWSPAVSVGLILISALVLRLKYRFASQEEITREIDELCAQIEKLKDLRVKKEE